MRQSQAGRGEGRRRKEGKAVFRRAARSQGRQRVRESGQGKDDRVRIRELEYRET